MENLFFVQRNEWTIIINNSEKRYDKTFFFGVTGRVHIDLVLKTNDHALEIKEETAMTLKTQIQAFYP